MSSSQPKYDFGGWATRYGLLCSDGRTIKKDAFKDCDGLVVPLVWNHGGSFGPENVLGQVILHNEPEGVYCYGAFNDTKNGQLGKALVVHGDINSLSIYANKLKQHAKDVVHGYIREVSLVLAGANPGAYIETVIAHSDNSDEEAILFNDNEDITVDLDEIKHSEDKKPENFNEERKEDMANNNSEKTVGEIFDTLTEEQRNVVYAIIGSVLEDQNDEDDDDDYEDGEEMKHNCFDGDDDRQSVNELSHAEVEMIFKDAKRVGSLKEAFIQHADEDAIIPYGIDNIDYLFPDDRAIESTPIKIKRDTGWVSVVMNGVHHTPFSKIKSILADLTEDQARAKGYIKGKYKKEEVFSLLKRSTSPTTVYKKQKLDRDDVIDITDFDVVSWLKGEMREMLDEEIARAVLIGDGRLSSDDDKISEDHIRPIWKDAELYSVHKTVPTGNDSEETAKNFIKSAIRARKDYKGSGNPTLFTTEDMLTECLLIEDTTGRRIYNSVSDLATSLRVDKIVTVPVMENQTRESDGVSLKLIGIIVNLKDYNIGADKGGSVNMFDDFDIDFNANKYLIETRCSGALVKPMSALVFEINETSGMVAPNPNNL